MLCGVRRVIGVCSRAWVKWISGTLTYDDSATTTRASNDITAGFDLLSLSGTRSVYTASANESTDYALSSVSAISLVPYSSGGKAYYVGFVNAQYDNVVYPNGSAAPDHIDPPGWLFIVDVGQPGAIPIDGYPAVVNLYSEGGLSTYQQLDDSGVGNGAQYGYDGFFTQFESNCSVATPPASGSSSTGSAQSSASSSSSTGSTDSQQCHGSTIVSAGDFVDSKYSVPPSQQNVASWVVQRNVTVTQTVTTFVVQLLWDNTATQFNNVSVGARMALYAASNCAQDVNDNSGAVLLGTTPVSTYPVSTFVLYYIYYESFQLSPPVTLLPGLYYIAFDSDSPYIKPLIQTSGEDDIHVYHDPTAVYNDPTFVPLDFAATVEFTGDYQYEYGYDALIDVQGYQCDDYSTHMLTPVPQCTVSSSTGSASTPPATNSSSIPAGFSLALGELDQGLYSYTVQDTFYTYSADSQYVATQSGLASLMAVQLVEPVSDFSYFYLALYDPSVGYDVAYSNAVGPSAGVTTYYVAIPYTSITAGSSYTLIIYLNGFGNLSVASADVDGAMLQIAVLIPTPLPRPPLGLLTECYQQGYNLTALTGEDLYYDGDNVTYAIRPCGVVSNTSFCSDSFNGGEFCEGSTTISISNVTLARFDPLVEAIWAQQEYDGEFGVTQFLQDGTYCPDLNVDREGTILYLCNATAVTPSISSVRLLTECHYQAIVQTAAICPQVPVNGISHVVGTSIVSSECGGGIYDLSPLSRVNLYGFGQNPYQEFAVRVCGTLPAAQCSNASVCEILLYNNDAVALAVWEPDVSPVVWQYISDGNVSALLQSGAGCGYAASNSLVNLTFVCDVTAHSPSIASAEQLQGCSYAITVLTDLVCGPAFLVPPPGLVLIHWLVRTLVVVRSFVTACCHQHELCARRLPAGTGRARPRRPHGSAHVPHQPLPGHSVRGSGERHYHDAGSAAHRTHRGR